MTTATSEFKNIKLHYFSVVKGSTTMGRGEFVRLLLEDAGVDFEYVKYNAAEWKEVKQQLIADKVRGPTMPYLSVDGKYYGKTLPIMRFISHKLGKYEGRNDEENQLLDAYSDAIMDWAFRWAIASFNDPTEEQKQNYKDNVAANAYKLFEDVLSDTEGPYLLGENISYADFVLYHMMEDDGSAINAVSQPYLSAFVQAIQSRPNMKKYLATDRK
jgi:glutathione S-transferase